MSDRPPILTVEHVGYRYSDDAPPVLEDVNLSVAAGESLAVVGPSGCGKSTLLNLIGALDRPSAGRIVLDDQDLAQLDARRLAAVRNRKIGFIFQEHHLLPQCTLLENVLLPTLAQPADRDGAPDRAADLLERVGLADRVNHRPGEVSGGQRQRAAVVRALINRPALLLADEPTGSLDRVSAQQLTELLVELNRQDGVTMIVVTHSHELAQRMQRFYELVDGRLQESQAGHAPWR